MDMPSIEAGGEGADMGADMGADIAALIQRPARGTADA